MHLEVHILPELFPFLLNIIAAILLAIIFKFFLWNNVKVFFEKRSRHVSDQLEDARKNEQEAKKILSDAENKLSKARNQANEIIKQANKSAYDIEQNMHLEIEEKRRLKKIQIKNEINLMVEEAKKNQESEIVDTAINILNKTLSKKTKDNDIKNSLKESLMKVK